MSQLADENAQIFTVDPAMERGRPTGRRTGKFVLIGAVACAVLVAPVVVFASLTPKSSASAAILNSAAANLNTTTDAAPRPDQFLYERIRFGSGQVGTFWLSLDGTHDGMMDRPDLGSGRIPIPGCKNGRQSLVIGTRTLAGKSMPCAPTPAYNTSMPTDAAAVEKMLQGAHAADPAAPSGDGKSLAALMEFSWLSKAQRIALLNAASKLPRLRVNRVLAAARPAAAGSPDLLEIDWNDSAGRSGGIKIDASTYQFIGLADDGDTVEQRAIVSAAGETP